MDEGLGRGEGGEGEQEKRKVCAYVRVHRAGAAVCFQTEKEWPSGRHSKRSTPDRQIDR